MIRLRATPRAVATVLALGIATLAACLDLPVAPPNEDSAVLRCTPDDLFEENDTPASALRVPYGLLRGLSCRRTADASQDYDFFVIAGTPDSTYRAWLVALDADSVAELRLFDDSTGVAVVPAIDGNVRMPASGRLLASVRLCCGVPGDSQPYELLLSNQPNRGPVASFDWTPPNPFVGATVTFNSLASDPDGDSLTTRTWRVSDGRTAVGISAGFVWDSAGSYTVTHVATDQWGRADSTTRPITIAAPIATIGISPSAPVLTALGDSLLLTAVARDSANAIVTGVPFVWSIDDTSIVTVRPTGLVVARAVGTARVRVGAFGVIDSVLVVVRQDIARVEAMPTSVVINSIAAAVALNATAFDARGNPIPGTTITWTSDSVAIVTVSPTGLLTPVANGVTTVRAAAGASEDTVAVTVSLPVTAGPLAAVIASPDTAMLVAPFTDSTKLHVRAVDANGVTLTGQTFIWQFLGFGGDFFIEPIGSAGDSARVVPPYYGTSSRRKMLIEVSSGGFADTLVFFVVAPRSWTQVSAGGAHTCGLSYSDYGTIQQELYCWGSNANGQLGLPLGVVDAVLPTRVPFDTLGFRQVAVGDQFTCAVAQGGSAFCWGRNDYGQLGGASAESCAGADCSHEPIELGISAATISAGPEHACASNPQFFFMGFGTPPELRCWGRNQSGQLGVNPLGAAFTTTPTIVSGLPTTGGINDVESFGQTSCALINNRRYCWGRNRSGEFGLGDTLSTFAPRVSPILPPTLLDTWMTGGDEFACGVPYNNTGTYGLLSCWGSDAAGQLGLAASFTRQSCGFGAYPCVTGATDAPFPQPLFGGTPLNPGANALVDAGARHACGLSAGQLLCWGYNGDGQLGDGTRTSRATPVSITFSTGYHNFVTSGRAHGCVDISQAGLYCWGSGANGRLGDGTRIDRLTPVRIIDP